MMRTLMGIVIIALFLTGHWILATILFVLLFI